MNGLKKWMVVLMTGVTLMGNVIGMGTTVIASKNETQESLSGVDVYMPENGSLERVIRVYEDGSFVTEISERTQRILLVNIQRDIWKHAVKKQIFRLWEQREYVIKND